MSLFDLSTLEEGALHKHYDKRLKNIVSIRNLGSNKVGVAGLATVYNFLKNVNLNHYRKNN